MIGWFESLNGSPTNSECSISVTGLFSDENCTDSYSLTDATLSYDDSGDNQLSFVTLTSSNQTEVYLCVENYVN
jgi:hypothetical protein